MNIHDWDDISNDLKFLACGPLPNAKRFSGYNINDFKFWIANWDEGLKIQNIGVFTNVEVGYYGRLDNIIKLNYYGRFYVVLFKCRWVNNNNGVRKDLLQFTSINFS